jgi:hypothetical protein
MANPTTPLVLHRVAKSWQTLIENFSRGKLEPDKWEMKRSSWAEYDPSFSISAFGATTTVGSRDSTEASPDATSPSSAGIFKTIRCVPSSTPLFFEGCGATLPGCKRIAMAYRVLQLHCREHTGRDLSDLRGNSAYESSERSETVWHALSTRHALERFAWGGR